MVVIRFMGYDGLMHSYGTDDDTTTVPNTTSAVHLHELFQLTPGHEVKSQSLVLTL